MNAALILIAASTLGIEVGWEPIVPGSDEVEYVIQVEPQLLETLKAGNDLVSELPAGLKIRRYKITVGTGRLPRDPSMDKLRAAVHLQDIHASEEEVAKEIPFRSKEPPARADKVAHEEPLRAAEPPAAIAEAPLAVNTAEEDREARERLREAEEQDREARARQREREEEARLAKEREDLEREARARAEQPAQEPAGNDAARPKEIGSRDDRGGDDRRHAQHETTTAEPKSIVNHRPTDANHDDGPRLASPDPLLNVYADEFKEFPESRGLAKVQQVNMQDGRDSHDHKNHENSAGTAPKTGAAPAKPHAEASKEKEATAEKPEPSKPWLITLLLLCTSLGGNVFLGMVAWGERLRSRNLLEKLHETATDS